ncbi:uncharacterized protein LOC142229394 [Haematobia irritans]|uniref:uncharacterized protein LOC142229394 n=1 Tax=Haematobia irritans TaxID=7368 RepID=UPI003F4F4AAA
MYSLTCVIAVIVKLLVLIMGLTMAAPTITETLINNNSNNKDVQQQQQQINNNSNKMHVQNAALLISSPTSTSSPSSSSASLSDQLSSVSSTNTQRLRKRHRKRHSNWDVYNNFNENSTILEWSNPCGGVFNPSVKNTRRPNKKEQKRIYKFLRNTAVNDFNRLNDSHRQDINISNIKIWWLHNYRYKFLPKLKQNSSIALKRWYRNMQTYVASFAYLRRIQYTWDHSKSQRESNTSAELKELLKSSRNMLCELEAAVNKTHPYKSVQMPLISRAQMNKRLKLLTKQRLDRNPNDLQEADSIDLKFVKYHYFEYLKNMWQILRKFNRRKGQIALSMETSQASRDDLENQTQFNEIEKTNVGKSTKSRSRGRGRHSKSRNKYL